MQRDKYDFLKKEFEKKFPPFLLSQEEITNLMLLKEILKEKEGIVQISFLSQEPFLNGSQRDSYRINLFLPIQTLSPQERAGEFYQFFKNTLRGVDAKDIFFNIAQSDFYQYSFQLLIQEGV